MFFGPKNHPGKNIFFGQKIGPKSHVFVHKIIKKIMILHKKYGFSRVMIVHES